MWNDKAYVLSLKQFMFNKGERYMHMDNYNIKWVYVKNNRGLILCLYLARERSRVERRLKECVNRGWGEMEEAGKT
jgi:hypothetical protein